MRLYRPIFRASAMQEYRQRREADVLPRLLPLYTFIYFYILLGLFLLSGLLALRAEVPIFISGPGTLRAEGTIFPAGSGQAEAILFLPATYRFRLHSGLEAQIEMGASRHRLTGTVRLIEAATFNPDQATRRYMLAPAIAHMLPQRSVVVTLSLAGGDVAHFSVGEPVHARVQIGSRSIFSLLSGT